MTYEDAVTIAGIISDVITSRRGASLFPDGKDKAPSNLGAIWIDQILRIPEEDAELATRAAIELFTSSTSVPMPTDFHQMLRKLRKDKQMSTPALPEVEYERDLPRWVKGKMLALSRSDTRVWAEQKIAYDSAQREYPFDRKYVWSEQEQMPEDERARYEEDGSLLHAKDFKAIFSAVTGS